MGLPTGGDPMAITQRDLVAHYRENLDLAQELVQAWSRLRRELIAQLDGVKEQRTRARRALSEAYLLELSHDGLGRVERLTGYRGFTRRDPLKAMAHEEQVLRRTIATIEADERYVRRQYLVGPNGSLTRELDEARGMLEPWQAECARFEDLDDFLELVEIKYDTDQFAETWWQAKYWKHWAAGDRICAELGLDDFGDDVLPAYHKVREPRDRWLAEVRRVEAEIDEVHGLVQRRDQAEARIPQLPALYLDSCHEQLAEFFGTADLGLLEEWLEQEAGGDRGVQQVLRRCAGLGAKVRFLDELIAGATQQVEAYEGRAAKYQRKIIKYQRSKYYNQRFTERQMDPRFQVKREKYRAQPGKLAKQAVRVIDFEDYSSFDLQNDPELWWVTMVRKRPSRFTPQLQSWYARNPDAAPDLDDDGLEDAVLAAAVAYDSTDRGYLS